MYDNEKEERRYVKTRLEHWNDLSMLSPSFLKAFVFRGQGFCDWHIKSALERLMERFYKNGTQKRIYPAGFEADMLNDFRWKYPNYVRSNMPDEDEMIEWLSIMQHYGSCTRMVDFTISPYVALFMAIDSSEGEKDCTVWCLNHLVLSGKFSEDYHTKRENLLFDNPNRKPSIYKHANQLLKESVNDTKRDFFPYVYLVRPCKVNERIIRQQGLFAIPEKIDIPFEDNLLAMVGSKEPKEVPFSEIIDYSNSEKRSSPNDYVLIKIDIPACFRYEITKSLYLMNMTAESLFPDLTGLAKSENYQRYF